MTNSLQILAGYNLSFSLFGAVDGNLVFGLSIGYSRMGFNQVKGMSLHFVNRVGKHFLRSQ